MQSEDEEAEVRLPKIKDKHGKTGRGRSTWKFLDALDAVLGHKPATRPPLVLDTSEDHAERDESDDDAEVEDDLSAVDMMDPGGGGGQGGQCPPPAWSKKNLYL